MRSIGWILVVFLALGCQEAEPSLVVESLDEGPVVMNLTEPDAAPEGALRLLWSSTSGEWGEPTTVRLSGTGLAAVVDPLAARIHLLAQGGETVGRWGERGEGPGEWQGLGNALFEGDHLLVQPSSAGHLERFTHAGELVDRIEVGQSVGLVGTADSMVIGVSRAEMDALVLVGLSEGGVVRSLAMGPPPDRYPAEQYGTCWRHAVGADAVFRLSCAAGRIQEVGLDGTHRRWIELGDGPRRSTEDELDAYTERLWDDVAGGREMDPVLARQLDAVRNQVAIRPKYLGLRSDSASGRLFLLEQPFGDYGDGDAVLHVVDPEGRHEQRIETGLHVRSFDVVGDTVALLVRDDLTGVIGLEVHLLEGA